ncbi:MAG: Aspartate carbamoyltransferase [Chlamydiae bacterium]|nr:Aspartate carbamoyltransferase [Chlamydiota bacterium]
MSVKTLNRHLVSIRDLSREDIVGILDAAKGFKETPNQTILQGKLLGSCFFEPSTRTRLSFESAMKRLGGDVIGFSDDKVTSFQKGESLYDTMKVMSGYVDLIVLRHPLEGAAKLAAEASDVPVINAGDGANEHPSQTLLDLFTIQETRGTLLGLHLGLMGDLLNGRTVHSLVQACSLFDVRFYFISPPSLELPAEICRELKRSSALFSFHRSLEDVIDKLDILYMTRVQRERMSAQADQHLPRSGYVLQPDLLQHAKENLKILHPLPRVDELDRSIDSTPYAYYFQQAQNGIPIRQAVLDLLLGGMS